MDGRVAPIMSSTPRLMSEAMVSGEVNLPTPTTGLSGHRLNKVDVRLVNILRGKP